VRIDERRGEMEEAKSGAEREDQQECRAVVSRRRRCASDGAINFGSMDVLGPF
jgi:hypothetical protein